MSKEPIKQNRTFARLFGQLRATIQPCVTASVGYASGFQEAESLEGLIRNITGNLNQVLAPILKKIRSKEDESIGVINDHLDYGMFSCKVKDKFGGTLTVAYKYTPVLIALHKEMTDLLNSQIPSHIEEQIQQSGLEPVEAEALRQRFYNLIPKATTAYTQNAKRIMWYKLPVILSDTINGLVEETICAASNEVSQMIFENDEGKTVGFIIDTKDIVEDTLRRLRKRARERMGAYSQGGPRRPKNHWKTWEGRKEFAQKVLEIRRPIKPILEENPPASSSLRQANRHIKLKDNDTVWEYIIKLLDYWGYEEEEDVYGLARWVALEWVPRDLIFEAFRQRKPHHRDYTPPDFSPQAYEYYHACYELNIDPRRKFNTLKSWFRKGSQGL